MTGDSPDSSGQSFTELLVSVRMETVGLKLYFKDHPLVRNHLHCWNDPFFDFEMRILSCEKNFVQKLGNKD